MRILVLPSTTSLTGPLAVGTSVTTPLVIGGTAASSTLTLESTSGVGTTDAILFKTGSQVEVARLTTLGYLGLGTASPVQRFHISSGGIRFDHLSGPTAPTVALAGAGAGNLTNGAYTYRLSYVTAAGETALGTVSGTVTVTDATTNGQVALTAIPVSTNATVTARKIYRTVAGQVPPEYQFVATLSDNTTTTYTDNIADASLTTYIKWLGDSAGSLFSSAIKGIAIESDARSVVFNSALSGDLHMSPNTTRNSPASRRNAVRFAANGYLYVIGGDDATTAQTTVYYSKIAPNGRLGAWSTEATNVLPAARTHQASVFVNGYIYAIAGSNAAALSGGQTTVYYAKPQPSGAMGAWATTTALPAALSQAAAVYHGGYIYVSGGLDTSSNTASTVYYAKVNADGTLGAWITSVNAMTVALAYHGFAVTNGYLYITGGRTGSANTTAVTPVYYSLIGANGAPGAFSTSGQALPVAISDHGTMVDNGFLYALGGVNSAGTNVAVAYYAALGGASGISAGEIGAWATASQNTGNSGPQRVSHWLEYWYFGIPASGVIRVLSSNRVVMGSNLSLIPGVQNSGMGGGSGGKLWAGNIFSSNKLEVMGAAFLRGDVQIHNTFGVSAPAADSVATGTGNAAGTTFSIVGATGGANSSTGSVAAGLGGILQLTGGTGGAETGASGTNIGGAGGTIELLGGTGGAATSGTGGAGGNLFLTGGAVGSGGSPVAGNVILARTSGGTNRGSVGIGVATPAFTLDVGGTVGATGVLTAVSGTAATGGGVQAVTLGSAATFGVYWGSGAPTIAAAKGSLYLRTDGTGAADRAYINTNASTTWTAIVTVA